ncbi:hypothetical protein DID88_000774 [Monilinia fructigena]|uniref:Uncharacterized protein n=1 Tax=Monilinia fructigena TaxID=38457 RepID=A0A395IP49_9HELO|nr:hypothetical protein DID88_000774 [Monilinia fructigena]
MYGILQNIHLHTKQDKKESRSTGLSITDVYIWEVSTTSAPTTTSTSFYLPTTQFIHIDFMSSPENKSDSPRPRPLQSSKSFSIEEPSSSPDRSFRPLRANTIQNGTIPSVLVSDKTKSRENRRPGTQSDILEKSSEDGGNGKTADVSGKLPADFDELPIELVSLADSFIDSLSAKIHPTPPSVGQIIGAFFKISMLSPAPSVSSLSSTASKFRAKAASMNKERPKVIERRESEQQMLTSEEINERKHARKALEHKRVALEEAIERRVCEGIYDRIWRHRSSQDEAQDEKLRSKTAALSVVGIGLVDLGVDLGIEASKEPDAAEKREIEVREWLEDLASLRADEVPSGPPKLNSQPGTPKADKPDPLTVGITPAAPSAPATVLVRLQILQSQKTLDDARKLISTPPPEDEGSVSGGSTPQSPSVKEHKNEPNTELKTEGRSRSDSAPRLDDRVLSFIGGRKMTRERSTDSNRSGGSSSKKVTFVQDEGGEKGTLSLQAPANNPAIVESMRNLGNSLNPMNRIAGMGMMRGIRTCNDSYPTTPTKSTVPDEGVADLTTAFPNLVPSLPPRKL